MDTKNDRITLKIKKRANLIKFLNELENFVRKNWNIKIKNNGSLIYLNIAALHHYPYSEFLFNFGRYNLFKALESDK